MHEDILCIQLRNTRFELVICQATTKLLRMQWQLIKLQQRVKDGCELIP